MNLASVPPATKRVYYLSGPISDSDPVKQALNLRRFQFVAMKLRRHGCEVFNPADLESDGVSWEKYLARDLLWIYENRPVMYMLFNWKASRGARLESEFAALLRLEVEYET